MRLLVRKLLVEAIGYLCGLAILLCALPATASVQTFFGIDLAAGPAGAHPNSDAARASYLASIAPTSVGVENFETVTLGAFPGGSRSLTFPSTGVTGTLQDLVNGSTANVAAIKNAAVGTDWFAISGTTYLFTEAKEGTSYFDLTFSQAITAIGFYGTSFSDYKSVPGGPFSPLQVILDGSTTVNVMEVDPATISNGSVHFFGLVSNTPFTTVRLFNPLQNDSLATPPTDGIAIDDITIGLRNEGVPEPTMFVVFGGLAMVVCGASRARMTVGLPIADVR